MIDNKNSDPENYPWLGRKLLWLDNMANVHRLFYCLAALCVILFLSDLVYQRHGIFEFEHFWGFYAIYGFCAFTFIIFAAKGLRRLVKRDERYYSPHVIDGEDYPKDQLGIAEHGDE